jgi:tetratricopeptide (TPR) repeat protein
VSALQGRQEAAKAMNQEAWDGLEKVLGLDHPITLDCAGYAASIYKNEGRYEVAEALYRRVLEGREKDYGPSHPHTIAGIHHLALILKLQGKYEEAETYKRRILPDCNEAYSPSQIAMLEEWRRHEPATRSRYRGNISTVVGYRLKMRQLLGRSS